MSALRSRHLAAVLAVATSLGSTLACGKSAPPPPVDDTVTGQGQTNSAPYESRDTPAARPGVTTGQKVVLLAGAAALYYMYKRHQNAAGQTGPEGQYYLSKNGRVYYRDSDHRAHWVTPPPEGLRVPESEAASLKGFQGYEGNPNGRDLVGLANDY